MALNGIDISAWQSSINLSKVPADFVICKATEGSSYKSKYFTKQIKQAKNSGKLIGAYHYVSGTGYKAEADYFIKVVKAYIGEALLCVDWESGSNKQWSNEAYLKNLVQYIYKKTGIKPVIYTQQSRMAAVKKALPGYKLWIAQYANYKHTGYQTSPWNEGAYECFIRQYSSSGRLSGYSGNLDLNKAYCTKAEWKAAAKKTTEIWQVDEDGIWGEDTTSLAQKIERITVSGKVYNQPSSNKDCFADEQCWCFVFKDKPKEGGSLLIRRIQNDCGIPWKDCDGYFGPNSVKRFIKKWVKNPNYFKKLLLPSVAVKNYQKYLNEQAKAQNITR